jgi:hypothetical protein
VFDVGAYDINFLCPEWNFDDGDCVPDTNDCEDDWKGDGYCDAVNNNPACAFDGGDCCASTCSGESCSNWVCSFAACHDPAANNNACFETEGGPDLDTADSCTTADGLPGFSDCDETCFDGSFLSWVGDDICDVGADGLNFNCEEWIFDGCDCSNNSSACEDADGDDAPIDDLVGGSAEEIGAGLFMFDYNLEGGSGPFPLEVGNKWVYNTFGPDEEGGMFALEITEVNDAGDVWTLETGPADMSDGEIMSMDGENTVWLEDNGDGTVSLNYDITTEGIGGFQFDFVFENSFACLTSFNQAVCEDNGCNWNATETEIEPGLGNQNADGYAIYFEDNDVEFACTTVYEVSELVCV